MCLRKYLRTLMCIVIGLGSLVGGKKIGEDIRYFERRAEILWKRG